MVKVFKFVGFWTTQDVQQNPKCLFIFGDNDIQKGRGGQAIIRGFPNALGIPTKKLPSMDPNAFYNDLELDQNLVKIEQSLNLIRERLKTGYFDYLVIPENGFGTGLSQLNSKAPQTLRFMNQLLRNFLNEIEYDSWKQFSFLH